MERGEVLIAPRDMPRKSMSAAIGIRKDFRPSAPTMAEPTPERGQPVRGKIGGGVIALGIIAMRTRTIFGGVLIHWSVAITMDVMAIVRSGGFR